MRERLGKFFGILFFSILCFLCLLCIWLIVTSLRDEEQVPASSTAAPFANMPVTKSVCFQETQYCITTPFLSFWESNGLDYGDTGVSHRESILLWGFPLTDPYTDPETGRLTQVFERMVFEHHPENAGTVYEVLLRRLGAELLATPTPAATSTPSPTPTAQPTPTKVIPTATKTPTPLPPTPTQTGATNVATDLDAIELEFVRLINAYRSQNGLVELVPLKSLNAASYYHSLDMGTNGYFAHNSQDGTTPWQRMAAQGYSYATTMAENIAAGQSSAQAVFNAWKASPGHNKNMLNPNMKAIGVGRVDVAGSPYRIYWTTDFGGVVAGP